MGLAVTHEDVFTDSIEEAVKICQLDSSVKINSYDPTTGSNRKHKKIIELGLKSIDPRLIERMIQPHGHFIFEDLDVQNLKNNPKQLKKHLKKGYTIFARNKALQTLALGLVNSKDLPEFFGVGLKPKSFPGSNLGGLKYLFPEGEKIMVAKPNISSHGLGVEIGTPEELGLLSIPGLISFDRHFSRSLDIMMAQSYVVPHSELPRATDLRVILLKDFETGNYRVEGMIRYGKKGSKISNLEMGGKAIGLRKNSFIEGDLEKKICGAYGVDSNNPQIPRKILASSLEYADLLGMPIAALDWGMGEEKPYLFEINFNPGPQIHHYNGFTQNPAMLGAVNSLGIVGNMIERNYVDYGYEYLAVANLINVVGRSLAFGLPCKDLIDNFEIDVGEVYGPEVKLFNGKIKYVENKND